MSYPVASELVYSLLYGAPAGQRFTQDSPVLPEVWLQLASAPDAQVNALIVPRKDKQAHDLAGELHDRLRAFRKGSGKDQREREANHVSDIPGIVGARLYLDELIGVILPLTRWWESHDLGHLVEFHMSASRALKNRFRDRYLSLFETLRKHDEMRREGGTMQDALFSRDARQVRLPLEEEGARGPSLNVGTLRLLMLLAILTLAEDGTIDLPDSGDAHGKRIRHFGDVDADALWKATDEVLRTAAFTLRDGAEDRAPTIFTVSLNRKAEGSSIDSVRTAKADAAKRLFEISCEDLAWAVIDSGINARHYAFRRLTAEDRTRITANWGKDPQADRQCQEAIPADDPGASRVVARYDMSFVYSLRDRDAMSSKAGREELADRITGDCGAITKERALEVLGRLNRDLEDRRPTDWDLVAELVEVAFDKPPMIDHGTHVAGILGGAWPEVDYDGTMVWAEGMCPGISLYDFKVVGGDARATEYAVIAAMRLIRHMNERNDFIVIHGANLSLSIPHDVTNYACGRTPVCEEAEKLHKSGVSVIAAAGNEGYNKFKTDAGTKAFHTQTSITDPGNAEEIVTVGATHRLEPHNYGVSYFSSRGPTGDGRMKPDLVAPGEKIRGPIGMDEFAILEGTSMAAPHVSGAAAMLMARFPELIGQPGRVKAILCNSATDVGRNRAFQGHGLLDILRALQSV